MKRIIAASVLAFICVLGAIGALGDTVYFGGSVKGKTKPAYIVFDTVKVESKFHRKLPNPTDPTYNKILQKRNDSVRKAVGDVANAKSYDVVVEMGDPTLKGAVDITTEVVKRLKKNEK